MSLTGSWSYAEFVEILCCGVQFGLVGRSERDVVQAGAVLMEAVDGNRPQRHQRAAQVVDDTAEQECERVASRLVGVVGDLDKNGPPEDALVELS